jgi:hypothetical protein
VAHIEKDISVPTKYFFALESLALLSQYLTPCARMIPWNKAWMMPSMRIILGYSMLVYSVGLLIVFRATVG